MASDNVPSTVELPANHDIKLLAHDIERRDHSEAVPFLLDFYNFLGPLLEEDLVYYDQLILDESRSGLRENFWADEVLDQLVHQGVVNAKGGRKYTLAEE